MKQPASGTSRVMLIPPSKKLPCGKVPGVPNFGVKDQGAGVLPWFTVAQAGSSFAVVMPSCALESRLRVPLEPPEPSHS